MQKNKITILAAFAIVSLVLFGCGGAPADNPDYEPPNFDPTTPGNSSSGGGSPISCSGSSEDLIEAAPAAGYLDCENLDVNKVYLYGTLDTDGGATALGDPLNPTSFCVSRLSPNGTISSDGLFLHLIDAYDGERIPANFISKAIGAFSRDTLYVDRNGDWEYSECDVDSTENDTVMYGVSSAAETVTKILSDPVYGNQLAYLYFNNIHASNGTLFHVLESSSAVALAILGDGTVLVGGPSGLASIIQDGGLVTQITTADDSGTNWQNVAKHHSSGIWLIVDDNGLQRWNLNLEMELESDGMLAARPDELADSTSPLSLAFDGSGNLWELHHTGNNTGVILRRPLATEGESEIVYRSSNGPTVDWRTNPDPYVFPFANASLVTGP